jgi:BioD-like phosphotransacetylase family protein
VVGATPREGSVGHAITTNLLESFEGEVVAVNPNHDEVLGVECVDSVAEAGAELAVVIVPPDAALITGGDRSDVQTVALEASGVKCLVLTGGLRPSSAVVGTAEERGVPIMTVRSDTRSTIDRAEDVVRRGRTRDETIVERMRELLSEHADVESVIG